MAEFKDVWFKYNKNEPDVLKGLSMKIRTGQLHCIVGGNGTGKTTALSLLEDYINHIAVKLCFEEKRYQDIQEKSFITEI